MNAELAKDLPATRSSVKMLLDSFEGVRCDHEGVASCIRCNVVYLAKKMRKVIGEEHPPLPEGPGPAEPPRPPLHRPVS